MTKSKLHYGWFVILAGLLVTIGAHGFGRMSYTLILPAMKDGLHFSYTELGLLGTGNFIGYLVMAIVGGFLATRFGSRVVITLALALMGVTMILTGLAESFLVAGCSRAWETAPLMFRPWPLVPHGFQSSVGDLPLA